MSGMGNRQRKGQPSEIEKQPKFKWQDALGVVGGLLAVGGMADMPLTLRILCFVGCAICLSVSFGSHRNWPKTIRWLLSIMVVGLMGFVSWAAIGKGSEHVPTAQEIAETTANLLREHNPSSSVSSKFPTMHSLFQDDLRRYFAFGRQLQVKNRLTGKVTNVEVKVVLDFDANSKFIAVFIPQVGDLEAYSMCQEFIGQYQHILDDTDEHFQMGNGMPGEEIVASQKLIFSRRVFIYHEDELSLQERASLEKLYEARNLVVQFRGLAYLSSMNTAAMLKQKSH
jgi:hypothetical protein